ncbi:hypothetical protein VCRA2121O337_90054 [Vibrio crassostreae]|nr:hypothetical protein VCRA2121O337_90054 [Vibrio crassostreae]
MRIKNKNIICIAMSKVMRAFTQKQQRLTIRTSFSLPNVLIREV